MAGPVMYPNVTRLPSSAPVGPMDGLKGGKIPGDGKPGEFDQALKSALDRPVGRESVDLNQIQTPLKFSAHAVQRMSDRKIVQTPELMNKVNQAVDRAASKGVEETLILTADAAFIVNIPNRTVVTAMDRKQLEGNVFTNIDGAVIV